MCRREILGSEPRDTSRIAVDQCVCVCYVPATRSCSNVTKKRKTAVWVGFSTLVFSFFLLLVILVLAVDILLADLLFVPVVDVASEKRRYKHELRPD